MTVFPQGRAWIELDRAALRHNVGVLRSLLPASCTLMPAVKANAYGHGAVPIARELYRLGVKAFCVASAAEGAELRRQGVRGDILVLGYTHPGQFPLLRRYRLMQTVIDYPYAQLLNQYGKALRVHIGIDTGMHRLGIRSEQIEDICRILQMKRLRVEGLFTHLCADGSQQPADEAFTLAQARAFDRVTDELAARGIPCPKRHLQSSDGVLHYPELAADYARVGLALYGIRSTREDARKAPILKPVLSLKARVATVKSLYPGEGAGYAQAYIADRDRTIAVLAIGYADGLPRALSCGVGAVLIHGRRAPIIGRICMDQTLVDVTDIPCVRAGDTAVVIGTCGDAAVSVYDLAEATHTIPNEVLSRLGGRLDRVRV